VEENVGETERNKQIVSRLFDAFRAGDIGAFDELIVDDYVQHNPQAGNGGRRPRTSSARSAHSTSRFIG
jgi:predicted SnoaL-like aldol condensation-catalyzing enzyme